MFYMRSQFNFYTYSCHLFFKLVLKILCALKSYNFHCLSWMNKFQVGIYNSPQNVTVINFYSRKLSLLWTNKSIVCAQQEVVGPHNRKVLPKVFPGNKCAQTAGRQGILLVIAPPWYQLLQILVLAEQAHRMVFFQNNSSPLSIQIINLYMHIDSCWTKKFMFLGKVKIFIWQKRSHIPSFVRFCYLCSFNWILRRLMGLYFFPCEQSDNWWYWCF